ncbi:hypothetical protein [Nonomuraea sp. SBT364]|uniref:hypothetical protein n=1 Tax=Nonomuraea sp. SBT364 TaxID=1580530 RepID=UPI00066EB469|nr:hypothetical protein [Nonomuraea sp. SBT364]
MSRRWVLLLLFVVTACGQGVALDGPTLDRVLGQGVAPDLIQLVELPGYELAEQSAGAVNEEGFGAVYTSPDGRQVELRVDRGPYRCAGTCERDGDGWYAVHDGKHEYVAVRDGHHLRLISDEGQVDRAVLRKAAEGARPAVGDGTPSPPPGPVERGDLPSHGDMAPHNPTGPGG